MSKKNVSGFLALGRTLNAHPKRMRASSHLVQADPCVFQESQPPNVSDSRCIAQLFCAAAVVHVLQAEKGPFALEDQSNHVVALLDGVHEWEAAPTICNVYVSAVLEEELHGTLSP